jgi:hypothetical protein
VQDYRGGGLYSGDYDLICICETWLNNTVLSSELLTGIPFFLKTGLVKLVAALCSEQFFYNKFLN